MRSMGGRPLGVKWYVRVYRRGRVRIRKTVKVACHRPVELPEGGSDLVRCGSALVEVTGWRTQWVGAVYKEITVQASRGARTHCWEYHVTQPYTSREGARAAAENSKLAGLRMDERWAALERGAA